MGFVRSVAWSSIGKKFLMAFTGLGLFAFVAFHLLENLTLLSGNKTAFNEWAHFLIGMGPYLVVVELALVAIFIIHVISGISVWLDKRRARPTPYAKVTNAGGTSKKSISSSTMIYTGAVLFAFILFHVKTFKYGPGVAEGYVQMIDGQPVRDLYRLVIETFSQIGYVAWYVGALLLLGFHLRHGIWSAFQSLGTLNKRFSPILYALGIIFAILIALGFIVLPVWIYVKGGAA